MKRILSVLLSFTMILGCFAFPSVSDAADKPGVESTLLALETQAGYIPGGAASVQYNCFAFVSDVCSKLYGVTYYYEQQDGNYKFKHTNNYFTVSETTFPFSNSTETRKTYAASLKDWLLKNAAVGDILQYGSADPSYSKRHTVLIQHIDKDKIQILHSNYETQNIPATACRLDTIYWNSLLSDPMNNKYNGGTLYSLNLLFGSQMKLTGGFGLSLNRYSFLEQKYTLEKYSKYVPSITGTERTSCTSIKMKWRSIKDVSAYSLEYKMYDDQNWEVASSNVTANNYTFTGLKTGETYCFRLRGFAQNKWNDYSTEVVKSALPPKVGSVNISNCPTGIALSWNTRKDITGFILYRSEQMYDGYYPYYADTKDINSFVDTQIEYGKSYYYIVRRYVTVNGVNIYSDPSDPVGMTYSVNSPGGLTVSNHTKNSVRVSWNIPVNATGFVVSYKNTKTKKTKTVQTTNTSIILSGLSTGNKYEIKVKAINPVGASAYCKKKTITVKPKKVKLSSLSLKGRKIKIVWEKDSGVSGYEIYRATKKNGGYSRIKTVKGASKVSFTDTKTRAKTRYYYKVRSYVNVGKTKVYSSFSSVKSVKVNK